MQVSQGRQPFTGIGHSPGAVHIGSQRHIEANRAAAGSNFRQGYFMQFDIAETHRQCLLADCRRHYIVGIAHQAGIGCHFLAPGLAQQRVQRHALTTGSQIP
ncbi:hypothetical protein D3C81_1908170 [compost metagenome]